MANAEVRQTVIGSGNIFSATGDVRINYQLPPVEADERRVLLQLTENVRQFWIKGVLEGSVHEAALIDLRREARPDAIQHPWGSVLELPGRVARNLESEAGPAAVFSEAGHALLILGEPGGGKTITLLELARELIERFERDPHQPAPVVLNLSTWDRKRGALAGWIQSELKTKYFVPLRRSRNWLAGSRLVLLLDGLDEVPGESQSACIEAINRFLETDGAPGIAVCCRLADYLALPVRLRLTGAICLQPLTGGQIDAFLARAGSPLAGLRTTVQSDPLLLELAHSPLLLSVLSFAYRDVPAADITGREGETVESRRRELFDLFVRRMFKRAAQPPAEFHERATRGWLGWLASRMREHSITLFSLEQLQPSWLPTARDRWQYAFASRILNALVWGLLAWSCIMLNPEVHSLFVRGLGFVLVAGITAGGIAAIVDGFRLTNPPVERSRWSERGRVIGLIIVHACVMALVFGVVSAAFFTPVPKELLRAFGAPESFFGWGADAAMGFKSGLWYGIFFSLRHRRVTALQDIRLAESLRVSWSAVRRGLMIGAVPGAIVGVLLVGFLVHSRWEEFAHQPAILTAIAAFISIAIVTAFIAAIGGAIGMFAPADLPRRVRPDQWLRRCVFHAVFAGIVIGAIISLLFAPWIFSSDPNLSNRALLTNAGNFGVACAMWYGGFDALQHVTLRFLLHRRGLIPRRFIAFLEHAARLVLLQKVGSGYLFIHRQLLDFFADTRPADRSSPPDIRGHKPAE